MRSPDAKSRLLLSASTPKVHQRTLSPDVRSQEPTLTASVLPEPLLQHGDLLTGEPRRISDRLRGSLCPRRSRQQGFVSEVCTWTCPNLAFVDGRERSSPLGPVNIPPHESRQWMIRVTPGRDDITRELHKADRAVCSWLASGASRTTGWICDAALVEAAPDVSLESERAPRAQAQRRHRRPQGHRPRAG
jgi:hypothetical protein